MADELNHPDPASAQNRPPEIAPTPRSPTPAGINVAPGPQDDGWHTPDPVTLADSTRLQLYKDGQALLAAYQAIESAQHRVCLEVYIFASDDTGRAFADLLSKKARQGVAVYVIYDSFGSILSDREMFRRMRRSGVHLLEFHPIRPWETTYSWRPVNRDHRKLLVVDDHIAGTGGLNIATEYAGSWLGGSRHPNDYWRDNAVSIIGPGARLLLKSFASTWRYIIHGGRIQQTEYVKNLGPFTTPHRSVAYNSLRRSESSRTRSSSRRPTFAGTHAAYRGALLDPHDHPVGEIGVLASAPTISSPLWGFFSQMLRAATQSIHITMAYFAPADELINELCRAAQRGVRVRLMLPGKSDVPLLTIAARSFYNRLLSAGVEIFERQGAVLHAKALLIDAETTLLGSINLDYRSVDYNCEISVLIRNRQFGQQVRDLFNNDTRYARQIDAGEFSRQSWRDRLIQWTVDRARTIL